MRTRSLYRHRDSLGNEHIDVVWFGTIGKQAVGFDNQLWDVATWDDTPGEALFLHEDRSSFSEKQQSVVDSLTQRLSIIRGELWYAMSYGLPLFEKNRSKLEFDAFIIKTITEHPDVDSIISFKSDVKGSNYACEVKIQSKYGPIVINL